MTCRNTRSTRVRKSANNPIVSIFDFLLGLRPFESILNESREERKTVLSTLGKTSTGLLILFVNLCFNIFRVIVLPLSLPLVQL